MTVPASRWSRDRPQADETKTGSWAFRLQYSDIEADAVLGDFTDSDLGGGGTDTRGFLSKVQYMLDKKVEAGLSLYVNEKNVSTTKDDIVRVFADISVSF